MPKKRFVHSSMGRVVELFWKCGGFCGIVISKHKHGDNLMRKLNKILSLLYKLRNRSQPKTETKVKVDVQQKITVIVVNNDN